MLSQSERLVKLNFQHQSAHFFSITLRHYTVDILLRESDDAVVLFDHLGIAERNPDRKRPGWGFSFILEKTDKTAIFVKPIESNWFRPLGLFQLCAELANSGFFDRYKTIMTYGSSMGGYAAIAYADAFRASHVISMNPQATLSRDLAPWDARFAKGCQQDWKAFPQIASMGCQSAKQVIIVFDRRCNEDAAHVKLLNLTSSIELNLPFVGHGIPYHLLKLGLIEKLFIDAYKDDFNVAKWRQMFRARRTLESYQNRIMEFKASRL